MIIKFFGRFRKRNPFRGKRADFISENPLFYKVMKRDRKIFVIKKKKKR